MIGSTEAECEELLTKVSIKGIFVLKLMMDFVGRMVKAFKGLKRESLD
jgi:hypothetical protein